MLIRHRALLAALALAVLLVAGSALSGCTTKVVTASNAQPTNTVTSSGSGKVQAVPDEAVMAFGVTAQDANAKKALDEASAAAKKITAALKKEGIASEDIQTSNVSVYPQQTDQSGKVVITGYQATISVNAKVKDIGNLGDIITAANDAGADTISGPSFTISEDSTYRAEAIDKAVADARKSAEAMAKAAGKSVGDVLSMSSANVSVPLPMGGTAYAADAARAAVPIEPGQVEVTADVTVVFELK